MTIQNLIDSLTAYQGLAWGYFIAIIIITLILVQLANPTNFESLKYIMSVLVYAVTIPGILAVILTFYSLFIVKSDLLNVSIIIYFVPIVSMVITLFILSKKIGMKHIPGFDRLSGLMIMIGVSFLIVFVLQRTYFGVLFIGGFTQLLVVFAVLFIIVKVGWARLMK
jgi:hypothetical protein